MTLKDCATKGVTASTLDGGFGFIVLCLDDLPSEVSVTISRIRSIFKDPYIRLAMPLRLACDEMERYKKFKVPIDMSEGTITGMMNLSSSKSSFDWNLILMAGACVTQNLIKKYLYFCRHDKDFVYPVVDRKWVFSEASINGMLYNKNTTPEAPENESEMPMAKAAWGAEIIRSGGRLKAIIGAKF
jgi:hypothetical protein